LSWGSALIRLLLVGFVVLAGRAATLPEGHAGWRVCSGCHTKQARLWQKSPMGRALELPETRDCYNYHSTVAVRDQKLDIASVSPGVQCETCHGPGAAHVAAAGRKPMKKLAAERAEEMNDLCGSCHRT
jgi:hypothetical protein